MYPATSLVAQHLSSLACDCSLAVLLPELHMSAQSVWGAV